MRSAAFQLRYLLSDVDIPRPTAEATVGYLDRGKAFSVEGEADGKTASFTAEGKAELFAAEVSAIGEQDQFALIDPTKGDSQVRFVRECGDVEKRPAFSLVERRVVEQALRYFLESGRRAGHGGLPD